MAETNRRLKISKLKALSEMYECNLGLIIDVRSSSDSLPGIKPFTSFSAHARLSSSSADTDDGWAGLSPAFNNDNSVINNA